MRLNCPNCGNGYEVPDGMIPTGGRHVQCTDCHTRWFVRGIARPLLSEEQIITRLEARARPRPMPVPDPVPAPEASSPAGERVDFVWEDAGEANPSAAEPTAAEFVPAPPQSPPQARAPAPAARTPPPQPREPAAASEKPSPRTSTPAPPAETPSPEPRPPASGQAGETPPPPISTPEAPASDPRPPDPARPAAARQTASRPRIDLTAGTAAPAPAPSRSRFARGLAVPLALLALAHFAYVAHEAIGSRLPGAAPALDAYAGAIEALRADIAALLGGRTDGG